MNTCTVRYLVGETMFDVHIMNANMRGTVDIRWACMHMLSENSIFVILQLDMRLS